MKHLKLITLILMLSLTIAPAYALEEQSDQVSETQLEETTTAEDTELQLEDMSLEMSASMAEEGAGSTISGSAMPFLGESFQTDLATGAATLSIPVTIPPGRKNMQPSVGLSYSSNNSNGICGMGWSIPSNTIQRSTKNGTPTYDATDTFTFAASGSNAELVNIGGDEYRAKIESAFMKYIFQTNTWTVYDKSGTKYFFGQDLTSRIENSGNTFSWHLDRVEDLHGNYVTYTYEKPGDGQIYLKEIHYTGGTGLSADKLVTFNYEDRPDKLFSYRSGWNMTTGKRLTSIHVKLNENLIWRYELSYIESPDTDRSLLESITVYDKDSNSLPPKRFTYQRLD